MNNAKINEDIIIDGLSEIAFGAYKSTLEGRVDYFETHTAADMIREYENQTGCAANEFFVAFATVAYKSSLEAIAKGKARREALSA